MKNCSVNLDHGHVSVLPAENGRYGHLGQWPGLSLQRKGEKLLSDVLA